MKCVQILPITPHYSFILYKEYYNIEIHFLNTVSEAGADIENSVIPLNTCIKVYCGHGGEQFSIIAARGDVYIIVRVLYYFYNNRSLTGTAWERRSVTET